MSFSIIIINYKTPELTADCLRSLFKLDNSLIKEIIVIDNNSEDNSVSQLTAEFGDKIKIIENKNNRGFARANNQGAAQASGDLLLFLNSDTIISEDIFSSCLKIFQTEEKIGIISPLLKTEDNITQEDSYGSFPTLSRLIFKNRFKKTLDKERIEEYFPVDWVSGCALMIRKDLFDRLGAWDENFFLYFEDVDLCYRAKKLAYEVVLNPRTNITHLGGKSLQLNKKRKRYYYQAQNYYFKKCHGFLTQILMRILRLPLKIKKMI